MVDHGKYAAAVSWSHQPYAIVASSAVEASSATRRVLPIPGSPDTNTNRRRPAATLAHASCSTSSSRSRPTHDDRAASTRRRGSHAGATSSSCRVFAAEESMRGVPRVGAVWGTSWSRIWSSSCWSSRRRVDTEFVAQIDSQCGDGAQCVGLIAGLVVGADQQRPQRLAYRVVQAESGEIADDTGVALGETVLVEPFGDRQGELVETATFVIEHAACAGAEERVAPAGREQRSKRARIGCRRRGHRRDRTRSVSASSRYAEPTVTIRSAMPTSARSREMWNRNARSPDAGGRPSQIRSRSASVSIAVHRWRASRASRVQRSGEPGVWTTPWSSITSTGPSRRTVGIDTPLRSIRTSTLPERR